MSIWSKIFSSGASTLIKDVGGVIDELTTTTEIDIKTKIGGNDF